MSDCGNSAVAPKGSSDVKPGCTSAAAGDSGCPGASSTTTTASSTASSTAPSKDKPGPSAASIALIAPFTPQIVVAKTLATTFLGAVDTVLDMAIPVLKQAGDVMGKINAAKDFSYIEKELEQKTEIEMKAISDALNALLEDYKTKNKGETNVDKLIANLNEFHVGINKILKTGTTDQSGGKKIISRTNKSINQFLNPKITFANMLKSKSKRKRVTKSKSKSKKRTRY